MTKITADAKSMGKLFDTVHSCGSCKNKKQNIAYPEYTSVTLHSDGVSVQAADA